jgi:hypothetical protein
LDVINFSMAWIGCFHIKVVALNELLIGLKICRM